MGCLWILVTPVDQLRLYQSDMTSLQCFLKFWYCLLWNPSCYSELCIVRHFEWLKTFVLHINSHSLIYWCIIYLFVPLNIHPKYLIVQWCVLVVMSTYEFAWKYLGFELNSPLDNIIDVAFLPYLSLYIILLHLYALLLYQLFELRGSETTHGVLTHRQILTLHSPWSLK